MVAFRRFLIRMAFFVGEHLAPRLTGRGAFNLFARTPDPGQVSQKEKRSLEEINRYMTQAKLRFLPLDGGIAMASYDFSPEPGVPGRGRVLVLHGWRSRSEHLVAVIDRLRKRGFGVVSIDFPGHGSSGGRSLDMATAVRSVQVANARFGPFTVMLGHSFGGAVAVNAVSGSIRGIDKLEVERLILISAPSSMPFMFERFADFVGLGKRSRGALFEAVREATGNPLESFVGAKQLAASALPALVIHSPDDRIVPSREANAYGDAGDHVEVHWAPGLGHRRILSDPAVLRRIAEFAIGRDHLEVVG